MFIVNEMMGQVSKQVEIFETEMDASDYLIERWEEAREEAILFHDDLSEDDVMQDFISHFSIEDDGRKLIDEDEVEEHYKAGLDDMGTVTIGGLEFYPSTILEKCDPIAYACGLSDFYSCNLCEYYYCEGME